jgi:hypothetical protein
METHLRDPSPAENDQQYAAWKHRRDMATMLLEPGMVDRWGLAAALPHTHTHTDTHAHASQTREGAHLTAHPL